MRLPLSIIIPTFNEEKYLPLLLQSIQEQTILPKEIIVADAFSKDKTREIAQNFGCRLVDGGLPAKARNNGATAAKEETLLFLDADVVLPSFFLEETFQEMKKRHLDIASCFLTPTSKLKRDRLLYQLTNQYLKLTQKFHSHIQGVCIFIEKGLHQRIGGFDESLLLAEDHDYAQKVKKIGNFGYLRCYKIPVSPRRLSKEGRIRLALKYVSMELYLIFLGKIKKNFFNYKFGEYR